MTKSKKILLFASIGLLSIGTLGTSVGLAIAGFERRQTIKDPTQADTDLRITADGKRLTNYYLDIGIWGTIDNTDYSFWALVFKYNDGETPTTLKYIKGDLDGSNYRYSIDRAVYDRIKYFRTASTNDATLATSTNYQHSYYTSTSPGLATDATAELTYEDGKTTYQVTGWHGSWIDCAGFWR